MNKATTVQQPENVNIRRYLYAKAARTHTPLSGTFELTPRCNMNCKMCYIRLSKEQQERIAPEKTAKEWLQLGKTCRDAGMLFLLLTGGEPFLRPDFREIYEGLYDLGLLLSINTNGTMITEETIKWLKERPPVKINLTLYGSSREVYGSLCGYADGYDRAIRAALMLKEAGILVSLNTSYTGENAADLEAIAAFVKENGFLTRVTSYMFPPVRKGEYDSEVKAHRMGGTEAGRVMWECERYRYGEEVWKTRSENIRNGIPQEDDRDCPLDEKMMCMAGRAAFWVTWNWQVRGCGMLTAPVLELKEKEFSAVWELLGTEMDKMRMPAACTSCKMRSACHVCGAVVQAEGRGNMEHPPEYVCQMTKEYVRLIYEEK